MNTNKKWYEGCIHNKTEYDTKNGKSFFIQGLKRLLNRLTTK
jgi:hypothetical protein